MLKNKWIRIVLLILTGFLLEFFVFNIRHFELLNCSSGTRSLEIPKESVTKIEENGKSGIQFKIEDNDGIPDDLRSITIEFTNPSENIINGTVHTDEVNFLSGHTRQIKIIPDVRHSHSIYLYSSNRVQRIIVTLDDMDPQAITLAMNKTVPLEFNWYRLTAILLILIFFAVVRPNSTVYTHLLNLYDWRQKIILIVLILIQVSFLVFTAFSTYPNLSEAFRKGNVREEDYLFKQHYQLLTEALFQKSFSILIEPPEKLKDAENPYDSLQRIDEFPKYEWDMSYYKGKYFVYFGVIPALTFYIPYTLLFNRYPLNDVAVLFFAIISLIGLVYCYTWFVRRFFAKIQAPVYFIGLGILLNASFLAWCVRRSFSYELALVSALCFSVVGLAFNLSAVRDDRIQLWKIIPGCFMMACAVGCRPTAIFTSILNIPIFLWIINRLRKQKRPAEIKKMMVFTAIPYIIVGIGLMFYNYERFDSVFEFGRTYQLSIQDSNAYINGLPISGFLIGIVNYIFGNSSNFMDLFPFLKTGNSLSFNFEGTKEFYGVFSIASVCPLLFLLFLIPFYWNRIKEKGILFSLSFVLLILLPVILSGMTGYIVGTIQRYSIDFSWMLVLASLFISFLVLENLENNFQQKAFFSFLLICFLITISYLPVLSCGETYMGRNWFELMNPVLYNKIGYLFAFWL